MTINRRAFAIGATLLAAPALLCRPARAAEFNWKFATNIPPTHPSNAQAQAAIDRIREQSGGRLNITLFPNNQLGGDTDMFSQLRSGAIQLFPISGLIVQTVVPEAGANGIGWAFKDYDIRSTGSGTTASARSRPAADRSARPRICKASRSASP